MAAGGKRNELWSYSQKPRTSSGSLLIFDLLWWRLAAMVYLIFLILERLKKG